MRSDEHSPQPVWPGWQTLLAGPVLFVVLTCALFGSAGTAQAQRADPVATGEAGGLSQLDARLMTAIYTSESGLFRTSMQVFDRSAVPLLLGLPPVAWVVDSSTLVDAPAWRLSAELMVTQISVFGATSLLKRIVRRERPYGRFVNIESRERGPITLDDNHGFPSGHAALTFSLATVVALNSERWDVRVPIWIIASGVSLSRVWLGVHYPSDILAGAALGTGVALLVHVAANALGVDGANDEGTVAQGSVMRSGMPLVVVRTSIGGS